MTLFFKTQILYVTDLKVKKIKHEREPKIISSSAKLKARDSLVCKSLNFKPKQRGNKVHRSQRALHDRQHAHISCIARCIRASSFRVDLPEYQTQSLKKKVIVQTLKT